jgi:hypothetical protein
MPALTLPTYRSSGQAPMATNQIAGLLAFISRHLRDNQNIKKDNSDGDNIKITKR